MNTDQKQKLEEASLGRSFSRSYLCSSVCICGYSSLLLRLRQGRLLELLGGHVLDDAVAHQHKPALGGRVLVVGQNRVRRAVGHVLDGDAVLEDDVLVLQQAEQALVV